MSNNKINTKKSQGFFDNKRLQLATIGLFILFLYVKILSFNFIGLDEPTLIIDNYKFLRNPSNISKVFTQHVFYAKHHVDNPKDYYRPVLTASFMLDAQVSRKPYPKFFHLANIIYHIFSCFLLFIFFHRLKIPPVTTFILTLLFAAHPLLTQAIAWIPGRNDSLITIFSLLSFIHLIKYAETHTTKNLLFHLLFFFVSMLTKESAIVLTLLSFYFLLFIRKEKLISKNNILLLSGYIILLTAWYFMRKNALSGGETSVHIKDFIPSLLSNFPLLIQYLQKMVLPFNLSVMSNVKDTNYILCTCAILILIACIFFTKQKRWNYFLFGFLWFIGFIAPSLLAGYFGGLEHRTYPSLVGLFIVISQIDFLKPESIKKYKYIFAAIVIVFTGVTFSRLSIFSNQLTYWESAVQTSDNSVLSCLNLGKTYETMGEYQKAIDAYREGLKRNPNERLLHNNIGGAYIFMKMYNEAEVEIKKEIELFPDNSLAYFNLGLIRKLTGKTSEAIPLWKKALEYDKNFEYCYRQLAEYYKSVNDTSDFNKCFAEITRINNIR